MNAYFVDKNVGHLFQEETPESVWHTPSWNLPISSKKMLDLNFFTGQ